MVQKCVNCPVVSNCTKLYVKLCATCNCGGLHLWFWVAIGTELTLHHCGFCILPVITQINYATCLTKAPILDYVFFPTIQAKGKNILLTFLPLPKS